MGKFETNALKLAWKRASKIGMTLWRNNIGLAVYPDGSTVKYGLCQGSSDLVGLYPVTITPEMVGQRVAVFVGLEIKTQAGVMTSKQSEWLSFVRTHGGIAGVVRDPADVGVAIERWRSKQT